MWKIRGKERVLTSSSISFLVLRPLAAKKSSRGFCSSLHTVSAKYGVLKGGRRTD